MLRPLDPTSMLMPTESSRLPSTSLTPSMDSEFLPPNFPLPLSPLLCPLLPLLLPPSLTSLCLLLPRRLLRSPLPGLPMPRLLPLPSPLLRLPLLRRGRGVRPRTRRPLLPPSSQSTPTLLASSPPVSMPLPLARLLPTSTPPPPSTLPSPPLPMLESPLDFPLPSLLVSPLLPLLLLLLPPLLPPVRPSSPPSRPTPATPSSTPSAKLLAVYTRLSQHADTRSLQGMTIP